jgi:hypothetical protein
MCAPSRRNRHPLLFRFRHQAVTPRPQRTAAARLSPLAVPRSLRHRRFPRSEGANGAQSPASVRIGGVIDTGRYGTAAGMGWGHQSRKLARRKSPRVRIRPFRQHGWFNGTLTLGGRSLVPVTRAQAHKTGRFTSYPHNHANTPLDQSSSSGFLFWVTAPKSLKATV